MASAKSRIVLVAAVLVLVAAFFIFDLGRFLTLDYLKSQQLAFQSFYADHRLAT